MLARDATFSRKFSHKKQKIYFLDEINGILKKVISFYVLYMFPFVAKCGFILKIAKFLIKPQFFTKLGF